MQDDKNNYLPYKEENTHTIQLSKHHCKIEYSLIQRKKLFFWMADASESVLCEVMKSINPAPYKKFMGPNKARLHALLVSADRVRSALELTGRKNPDRNLARLEETHDLHLSMIAPPKTRHSPKREKIALHAGIIRQLFARGYSLREACRYLKRHAGLTVNHSYLRQCCLDMGLETSGKKEAHEKNS